MTSDKIKIALMGIFRFTEVNHLTPKQLDENCSGIKTKVIL